MAPLSFRPLLARRAGWLLGIAAITLPMATPPALAQSAEEMRVRKLEQEVKALQRKVFPGTDGRYFEPQVTAPQLPPNTADMASTGPVADLLARMDAVEAALSRLTSQTEVNGNALALLNARVDNLERNREQMLTAGPNGNSAGSSSSGNAENIRYAEELASPPAASAGTATQSNMNAMATTRSAAPANSVAAAVERPQTGDAADDAYVYGYRLWDAGRHAEARKELEAMIKAYPKHRRVSWARNLIGRSYLDQSQPKPAAEWLLKNYLEDRNGERASDSLVYLASATLQLGNKAKACEALEEFRLVYPSDADGRLASTYTPIARKAGCN
ncbi:hypothetical protein RM533_08020 [Croceicoccus sp. F390]|uniref:Tetratricopeptide repeat protein n=1 Tax=Croceicoccus esteveae TaxID=3075597 RepID=A0ABU2ZHQ3_9SPHN|nr:tetratricopeptide repeat protein [Croceicoccus sp. F390]MDT0576132.1 hypothetical protein [Croceicoccus sp. F390]